MKTLYGQQFINVDSINNNNTQSKTIIQKNEERNGFNNKKEQNLFNQKKLIIINNNFTYYKNNNIDKVTKINNQINIPQKKRFNFMKNLNPTHMQFNNAVSGSNVKKKRIMNKNTFKNQDNNNQNNITNNKANKNQTIKNSVPLSKSNYDLSRENTKKKMGLSQMNFYNHKNNMNYFPNIHYQRPNLNSINDNWMVYSHQQNKMYNDLFNNIIRNNQQNLGNENFIQIFDFDYKRPEEKLKKGQNQLILERLQKKYVTQVREKPQNMHRTGTGFYQKNNNKDLGKNRQLSAQDNVGDSFKGIINVNNKNNKLDDNNKDKKNKNIIINKEKTSIDANKNEKEKLFNKTYNGFNLKKKNKEKRKKEKLIFSKIKNHFKKKSNYFWIRYFNKNRNKYINGYEKIKKNKSYDNIQILLFPKLIKKCIRTNLIHKKNYNKKNEIIYNTDNSEIDEIKLYKKNQKKFKNDYANFIKINKKKKEDDKNYSSSDSENSNRNKEEPKFKGIFDDNNEKNNNENSQNNEQNYNKNDKKRFNYKTTSNFYAKNNANFNNNNQETKNTEDKSKETESKKFKDDFDKEKNNKFIENLINNVIENNKRAAAARSSTSFYNIGSHFMNNHMRSTKTKFYNPKGNKGGGFTGTKDSNFTKEQANEGKFNKPNSLKLTLINPINWRKHEEIWENLVTLSMGLADLEKYLMPPNETDVLISSYLKMNPRILNFCSIQKINTSNTKNENNFISFMVDDNIQNPKQEIKKWKEAYKRVIFRWHPDKLFSVLEEIKLKNEQQKIELKKKSSIIINSTNTLYKNIMEILNKILQAKNQNDELK
jgi:hypothetical protein